MPLSPLPSPLSSASTAITPSRCSPPQQTPEAPWSASGKWRKTLKSSPCSDIMWGHSLRRESIEAQKQSSPRRSPNDHKTRVTVPAKQLESLPSTATPKGTPEHRMFETPRPLSIKRRCAGGPYNSQTPIRLATPLLRSHDAPKVCLRAIYLSNHLPSPPKHGAQAHPTVHRRPTLFGPPHILDTRRLVGCACAPFAWNTIGLRHSHSNDVETHTWIPGHWAIRRATLDFGIKQHNGRRLSNNRGRRHKKWLSPIQALPLSGHANDGFKGKNPGIFRSQSSMNKPRSTLRATRSTLNNLLHCHGRSH